jgi:hypothetical protein
VQRRAALVQPALVGRRRGRLRNLHRRREGAKPGGGRYDKLVAFIFGAFAVVAGS